MLTGDSVPLLVSGAATAVALVLMATARGSLELGPVYRRFVPRPLGHRWLMGIAAIAALLLFFAVPFLLLGAPHVALAGLVATALILALAGRDVVAWIVEDLAEHRLERRGLFQHRHDCAIHAHYDRPTDG